MNILGKMDPEHISVSKKFTPKEKALKYKEPKLQGNKVVFTDAPFPASIINQGSRLLEEPVTATVNRQEKPIVKNSTEVSTVNQGGFVHNSGINKKEHLGAGAFLIIKNKSNPEENYLLVAKRASRKKEYMAVYGGSRTNNQKLDSGAATVSKEILEETMGVVNMSTDQVESFANTYGVHVHNKQGRSIEAKLVNGNVESNNEIRYDNSESSYEYQTTMVEIEIDNPVGWQKIQEMTELASIAQETLNAFEYTEPSESESSQAKVLKGYPAVKKLEQQGLSEIASKQLKKNFDFNKIDTLINKVILKTPDGKQEGFKKLMNAIKKGEAVSAEDFLKGSQSLLNHTENQSYDLVDLKAFQQAAKETVEGNKPEIKLIVSGGSMPIHHRDAFVFERLRFESVKKSKARDLELQSKEIGKRIEKMKRQLPKKTIQQAAQKKPIRSRSARL